MKKSLSLAVIAATAMILAACRSTDETVTENVSETAASETTTAAAAVSEETTISTAAETTVETTAETAVETTVEITAETAADIGGLYREYIKSIMNDDNKNGQFMLLDLDSDGVDELVIEEQAIHHTLADIFTVSDGSVVKVDNIACSDLYYGDNMLLNVLSGMGDSCFEFYTMSGGKLELVKKFESSEWMDVPKTCVIDGIEVDEEAYDAALAEYNIDESSFTIDYYAPAQWYSLDYDGITQGLS